MNIELNCEITVFVTEDSNQVKRFYLTKTEESGVKFNKPYASKYALLGDIAQLDIVGNVWNGQPALLPGATNIPEGEKIKTQFGAKRIVNGGYGTRSGAIIIMHRQSNPKLDATFLKDDVMFFDWLQYHIDQ